MYINSFPEQHSCITSHFSFFLHRKEEMEVFLHCAKKKEAEQLGTKTAGYKDCWVQRLLINQCENTPKSVTSQSLLSLG